MQFFVKSLTGRKTLITTMDKTNTILELKEQLSENEGIEVKQIRLIFKGRQLSDGTTLNDYSIASKQDTIHMVLNLR